MDDRVVRVTEPDGIKQVPLVCVNDEGAREIIGSAIVGIKNGEVTVLSSDLTPGKLLDNLLQIDVGPLKGGFYSISDTTIEHPWEG